jgi:hypothetical protein
VEGVVDDVRNAAGVGRLRMLARVRKDVGPEELRMRRAAMNYASIAISMFSRAFECV